MAEKKREDKVVGQEKQKNNGRPPWQRMLAFVAVIALLALYGVTFVAALTSSPSANGLFFASLTLTFVIPAAIYVALWLRRVLKKD